VEIAYSGEELCAAALYAGAWFSAPYKAQVSFVKEDGYGPGLHRITLRADSEQIVFERKGIDCMSLHSTNGQKRSYTYEQPTDHSLMTEELAILGSDPAFDSAYVRAQELLNEQF
jgi:hypothetical protein